MTDIHDRSYWWQLAAEEKYFDSAPNCERCGAPMVDCGSWEPYGDIRVYRECWVCYCDEEDNHE